MPRDARNNIVALSEYIFDLNPEVGERRSNGLEMRAQLRGLGHLLRHCDLRNREQRGCPGLSSLRR